MHSIMYKNNVYTWTDYISILKQNNNKNISRHTKVYE